MSKQRRNGPSARPLPFGTPPRPVAPEVDERGEPRRASKVAAVIAVLLLLALISGPFLIFFS